MPLCGTENISVFSVGIKLGVTPNYISIADFATALNRILVIPVGEYGYGPKMTLKIF